MDSWRIEDLVMTKSHGSYLGALPSIGHGYFLQVL